MGKAARKASREQRSARQLTRFVCGWCPRLVFPIRQTWNDARKDWGAHNHTTHNHSWRKLKGDDGFQELACDNPPRGPLVTQIR